MEYFRELNWNFDISHTGPTIKDWCTQEQGNYRYFQIPIERLCDNFEIYKHLKEKLLAQDLILYKSKFMQMNPGDFMGIHIDQSVKRPDADANALHYYDSSNALEYASAATPVEVALNIPLLNSGEHITRWYQPKECDVSLKEAPCGPLPSINLADWPNKNLLVKELCVASHRLTKPSLIRTDILHNADARHSSRMRWIMSFRITDRKTKTFITWKDAARLEAINF